MSIKDDLILSGSYAMVYDEGFKKTNIYKLQYHTLTL